VAPEMPDVYAHRFSWEMHNGPIPNGMMVCHRCDNSRCVRPDHLFLGSAQDNVNDMIGKGRQPSYDDRRGPRSHFAKLAQRQVETIRMMYGSGRFRQADLASIFGVSRNCIQEITSGKSWR